MPGKTDNMNTRTRLTVTQLAVEEANREIKSLRERVEKLENSTLKVLDSTFHDLLGRVEALEKRIAKEDGEPLDPAPEVRTGTGESDGACYPCFVCGKSLPNGARCSCGYKPSPQQMGTYTHAPRNTTLATSSLRHLCLGPDGPVVRECCSLVCSLCGDGFKININPSCGSGEAIVCDEKTAWSIYHALTQPKPAPQPGERDWERGEVCSCGNRLTIAKWCSHCGRPPVLLNAPLSRAQVEEVCRNLLKYGETNGSFEWAKDGQYVMENYLAARAGRGKQKQETQPLTERDKESLYNSGIILGVGAESVAVDYRARAVALTRALREIANGRNRKVFDLPWAIAEAALRDFGVEDPHE